MIRKQKFFRESYNQLAKIRSFLPSDVPLVALTATATIETIKLIKSNLCMSSAVEFLQMQEKSNIKYFVLKLNDKPTEVFNAMVGDLKIKGYSYERCIIFCRRMADLRGIYKTFFDQLGRQYFDFKDMYHSHTR